MLSSVNPFADISGNPANLIAPIIPGVVASTVLTVQNGVFRFQSSSTVGVIAGGRHVLAVPQNLSETILVFSLASDNPPRLTFFDGTLTNPNGIMIAITDTSNNWRRWVVSGGNFSHDYLVTPMAVECAQTSTMQAQSATPPDLERINALEFHAVSNFTAAVNIRCARVWGVDRFLGATLVGGEVGHEASIASFLSYQSANTGLNFVRDLGDGIYSFSIPFTLATDLCSIEGATVTYVRRAGNGTTPIRPPQVHHARQGMNLNTAAGGVTEFFSSQLKNSDGFFIKSIDNAGAETRISSSLLVSTNTVELTNSVLIDGSIFNGFESVSIDGAEQRNVSYIGGTADPSIVIDSLGSSVSFYAFQLAGAIEFNLPPGDYSQLVADLDAGRVFNITQGQVPGEYIFTGLTGGTELGPVIFDNTGGGDVVIVVGSDIFAVAAAPVTAGTLVIQYPTSQIFLSNIPQVDGALVGVINLDTDEASFPSIIAGVCNVPTTPANTYLIVIDIPGYQAQRVVLSGATPAFEATLENNRDLYEAGVNIGSNLLFNYSTFEVTFVDGGGVVFNNANIYRTIEDYLATPEGVFFPNPPRPIRVPGRNFLFFPYDQAADMVNPVRVRPHPENLGNPRITDVVVILEGAEHPQTDIFDFSLAGGKTIFYQTDATVAEVTVLGGGGTGLGPEDIERLERIEQQLVADIYKGRDRYIKKLPGTDTVILDQDVVFDPEDGFTLLQHQEPAP